MRKAFLASVLMIAAATVFGQVSSKWQAVPVKADGKTNEWARPFDYYDNVTKMMFAVTNDDKNIYLCFESIEPTTHLKMMQAGITVTLNAKGKTKHRASISYPVMDNKGKPITPAGMAPGQRIDRAHGQALFLLTNKTILTEGFATKNGVLDMHDSLGVNAGLRWDSTNKMVYEIVIPLTEFYGAGYTPEELTKDLALTVEVNAMERPNFSPGGKAGDDMVNTSGVAGQNYGGMNSPNGIGAQNGTMGQGGMMGQPGAVGQPNTQMNRPDYPAPMERNVLYEKSTLKEKVTLAKKK